MSDRLAAAEAALKAGRRDEAIEQLIAAITEDPARPAAVYNALLIQLYQAGRHQDGEAWGARAMAQHPRDANLANVRGVMLRRLGRLEEALQVLDAAVRIDPRS